MATWQREGEGASGSNTTSKELQRARNSRKDLQNQWREQKTKVNLDCIRTCLISPPELLFWIYKKAVHLDENIHAKVWFQKKYYSDDF